MLLTSNRLNFTSSWLAYCRRTVSSRWFQNVSPFLHTQHNTICKMINFKAASGWRTTPPSPAAFHANATPSLSVPASASHSQFGGNQHQPPLMAPLGSLSAGSGSSTVRWGDTPLTRYAYIPEGVSNQVTVRGVLKSIAARNARTERGARTSRKRVNEGRWKESGIYICNFLCLSRLFQHAIFHFVWPTQYRYVHR